MTRLINFFRLAVLSAVLFGGWNDAGAEGTKQTTPYNAASGAEIQLQINRNATGGQASTFAGWTANTPGDRLFFHISNYQTERVYLGFQKANSGQNVFYRIKRPDGTVVAGPTAIPTSGTGYISTWSQANIGPSNLSGNAGGYTGILFNPNANANSQVNGDFYIEFNTSSSTANTNEIFLRYYDITVANGTANTNVKLGRLWSYNWGFNSQSFTSNGCYGSIYSYTTDQVVIEIDLNGLRPYYFRIFNNQWGCRNDSTIQVNRRSMEGSQGQYQYKLFLNNPDSVAYPSNANANRTITFTGLSGCGNNLCFNITIDGPAQAILMLDFNNNGLYTDPVDRILEQFVTAGNHCIPWDGKDGLGNTVPAGTVFPVSIASQVGITHLPIYDAENHPNGYLARLVRPLGIGNMTMFYDNLNLSAQGGVTSSAELFGVAPPLPLAGNAVNVNGINKWNTTSGSVYYGDDRTINTWWTIRKFAVSNYPVAKHSCSDLVVTKTDSSLQFTPGSPVVYTIQVTNNGPDPIPTGIGTIGARIMDTAPAGTSIGSWTAVFSGGASGTASGTGNIDQYVMMPVNATVKYTVTLNVPANFGNRLINLASTLLPTTVIDYNMQDNAARDTSYSVLGVAGTVWDDRDYSANGTFNSIYTAGESGTHAGGLLFVSLVNPLNGLVQQSAAVAANGSFAFNGVSPFSNGYQLVLSTVAGSVGQLPPSGAVPSPWQHTTPLSRTFNTDTNDQVNLDFGVRTQAARCDINQTVKNMPVAGKVSTNDRLLPGVVFASLGTMMSGTFNLNANGSYVYTPNLNFIGRDSIRYTVCTPNPGMLCDTATLTIEVSDQYNNVLNEALAQDDIATTLMGSPVTVCVRCNDSDPNGNVLGNPTLTSLPSHGTALLNGNGTITYTPNVNYRGRDAFTYSICDNAVPSACNTARVYVDVLSNSGNLTIANDDALMTTVNTPVAGTVSDNDTDPQNQTPVFALLSTPTNGTLVFNANGSFLYTPFADYYGPDRFVYSACDSGSPIACDSATVYISVNKPLFETNPDFNVTLIHISVSGSVHTNDQVPAGTTYGAAIAVPGNPGVAMPVISPNGSYTFVSPVQGVFHFLVPVCVPNVVQLCRFEMLTITVLPLGGDYPPIANTDIATTPVNVAVTLPSLANDMPALGYVLNPATVTITVAPLHGSATVNPVNGNIMYMPFPNYQGKDTLTYQVCQNTVPATCATAKQIITVIPVSLNNTTTAADDFNITPLNTVASGNVKSNDSDAEGDPQTVLAQTSTMPGKGTMVLNAGGEYTFTPVTGFIGPVEFVYTVCDNKNPQACANATLHIDVMPPDLTPNLSIVPNVVQGSTQLNVTVTVSELNHVATDGLITLYIPKDTRLSMTYNGAATMIGFTPVNNSSWNYNGANAHFHIFTRSASIPAAGSSTFGFTGTFTPTNRNGQFTSSCIISSGSGTEQRTNNNTDGESVLYYLD